MADSSSTGGNFNANSNGMFAGSSNEQSTSADYANWGWKQIEAAINGGSEISSAEGRQEAQGLSNPQTLWDAGNLFQYVEQVLTMVGKSLQDQANALASGSDAPWQGQAADAFLDTMTLFSKQVTANAQVLSGGSAGLDSVPQQLVNNGNALSKAQAVISAIDTWYANQAQKEGVKPMSNGLIPISQKPQLVEMMRNDMYNYGLKPLVANYQVTIDSIVSPTPSTPNLGTGGGSGSGSGSGSGNQPDQPAYQDSPLSPVSGQRTPGAALSPDAMMPAQGLAAQSMPAQSLAHSPGASPYHGAASQSGNPQSPAGFPGGSPAASTGGALGATPFMGARLAASPGAGSTSADASPYNGAMSPAAMRSLAASPAGSGDESGSPLTDSGMMPYDGGAVPSSKGALNDATTPSEEASGSPGTSGAGAGSPAASAGLSPGAGGLSPSAGGLSPAAAGAMTPLTSRLAASPAGDSQVSPFQPGAMSGTPAESKLAAGGGMPYMPGMGGMGAGGAGGLQAGADRPDAAGLLNGDVEPWDGAESPADSEALPGIGAGGPGLSGLSPAADAAATPFPADAVSPAASDGGLGTEPGALAAGGGMPYMPGMGGMGAGGAGGLQAGADRPDAAGLLNSEVEPWDGAESPAASEALPGANADGAGLTGAPMADSNGMPVAADAVGPAASDGGLGTEPGALDAGADGEGMPYMPGMGGMGAGAGARDGADRSDASGLLGGATEPWLGDEPEDLGTDALHEADALPGAAVGGAGLAGAPAVGAGVLKAGSVHPGSVKPDSAESDAPDSDAVEPDAAEPGSAGEAGGMPFMPGMGVGAGRRDETERSDSSALLAGETESWAGDEERAEPDPAAGTVAGGAELEGAVLDSAALAGQDATVGSDQQAEAEIVRPVELPADRVAVLPQAESPDDLDAWDVGGAAASFLLTAGARRGDGGAEGDLRTARFGTEEETWRNSPESVAAVEPDGDAGLATWRRAPVRAQGTADEEPYVENLRSSAATLEEAPVPEPEPADEDDAGEEHEKGIAELLVQDSALWGSWQGDPGALE